MGKTLEEIARQLSTPKLVQRTVPETTKVIEEAKPLPKVQLIYAFNGTGKTRLSRELKKLLPLRLQCGNLCTKNLRGTNERIKG